jgi:hypothetical protein
MRPLTIAEVPHMEAHPFAYRQGAKGIDLSRAGVPIRFDSKSQSFLVARQEMHGGRSATVFAPMSNHSGTLQARGGSFAGGSGFHGGSSASAGGGSRGSGSGNSGGGGSHSGGGGGGSTASSSSSAASSSSSGSSGGGGSHH